MTREKQKCIVRLLTEARVEVAAARHEVSNCKSVNRFAKTLSAQQPERSRIPVFAQESK